MPSVGCTPLSNIMHPLKDFLHPPPKYAPLSPEKCTPCVLGCTPFSQKSEKAAPERNGLWNQD